MSKVDEESGNYSLAAYLIAQLGKNYKNDANEKISGEQLLGINDQLSVFHIRE